MFFSQFANEPALVVKTRGDFFVSPNLLNLANGTSVESCILLGGKLKFMF